MGSGSAGARAEGPPGQGVVVCLWLANKGCCGGGAGLLLLAEADWLVAILVRDGLRGNLLCMHPSLIPNSFPVFVLTCQPTNK